jgi:uncharacterized heparinase superfamily protein
LKVAKMLGIELQQQFLADGGHISRNPDAGLEALVYLLPLQQLYARMAIEPPGELLTTLDRALPMLEFFRHRDGHSGLFNGGREQDRELLETVLRVGNRSGQPPDNAVHSGYQRLRAGSTILLADTGKARSVAHSRTMHAGCLSFEMSSGENRFIVNCGMPRADEGRLLQLARSTAAHSTAVINDTSSCRMQNHQSPVDKDVAPTISGINHVELLRSGDETGAWICASHDGYLAAFGIIHQRSIFLSHDGNNINGTDEFLQGKTSDHDTAAGNFAVIRFHLHPLVEPQMQENGVSVLLDTDTGEVWKFTCVDVAPTLEESVFFSDQLQQTKQIVLNVDLTQSTEIRWALEKCTSNKPSNHGKKTASPRQQPQDLLDMFTQQNDNGSTDE